MNGIYQVTVGGHNGTGNFAENVFHYVVSGSSPSEAAWLTAKKVADGFEATCVDNLVACMGDDCVIDQITAKRVDGPGSPSYTIGVHYPGTWGVNSYSNVVAVDVAMYPGGDANKVGHTYLWGIPKDGIEQDTVSSTFLTTLTDYLNTLFTLTITGASAVLATYSKALNIATFVTDLITRLKISGFSKRTAPVQ